MRRALRPAALEQGGCNNRRYMLPGIACSVSRPHRTAPRHRAARAAPHRTAPPPAYPRRPPPPALYALYLPSPPSTCPPACVRRCSACSHRKELFYYGSGFGNLFTAGLAALHGPRVPSAFEPRGLGCKEVRVGLLREGLAPNLT